MQPFQILSQLLEPIGASFALVAKKKPALRRAFC
jgi:hypothetical protein